MRQYTGTVWSVRECYTLVSRSGAGDSGFDVLRLVAPGPLSVEGVFVEVGGHRTAAREIEAHGDTLLISLAEIVQADVVFLPDLPASGALIRDLSMRPAIATPNGDGVNDLLELEFAVLKVASDNASVRIFDLTGKQVALLRRGTGSGVVSFAWPGTDDSGRPVLPGVYLTSVEVHAMSGVDRVVRSFALAY